MLAGGARARRWTGSPWTWGRSCSPPPTTPRSACARTLGLPLVRSQMKFGHFRNGRWVTTTPEQSLWNFVRHVRTAIAMGFGSPAGFRAGSRVMRQMHRQEDYLSFASDSPLAEIDDDETYGDYLKRLGVPRSLQLTLGGPLKMVLGDPEPAGQALMRAYIGETMLSSGTVHMPERGIGSFNAALAAACSDAVQVSTPVRQDHRRGRGGDGRGNRRRDHRGRRGDLRRARHAGPGSRSGAACGDTRRALGTVSYSTGCRVVIGLDRSTAACGLARRALPGGRRHPAAAGQLRLPTGLRARQPRPSRPAHRPRPRQGADPARRRGGQAPVAGRRSPQCSAGLGPSRRR